MASALARLIPRRRWGEVFAVTPATHDARDQELTWTQIGELLGTTAATAARRYRTKP